MGSWRTGKRVFLSQAELLRIRGDQILKNTESVTELDSSKLLENEKSKQLYFQDEFRNIGEHSKALE